jgi:hypothetical protein
MRRLLECELVSNEYVEDILRNILSWQFSSQIIFWQNCFFFHIDKKYKNSLHILVFSVIVIGKLHNLCYCICRIGETKTPIWHAKRPRPAQLPA